MAISIRCNDIMRNLFLAFAVLFLFSIAAATQSARHAFTVDDAATLHSAAAVAVSPDSKNVLYRVQFGGAKGPDNTEWHLIAAAGGESRHLTIPEKFEPLGFTRDGSLFTAHSK